VRRSCGRRGHGLNILASKGNGIFETDFLMIVF